MIIVSFKKVVKLFYKQNYQLLLIIFFTFFLSSCSQNPEKEIKKIGFPINKKVTGIIHIDWVQNGEQNQGGPDKVNMLLTVDKFEARIDRLNFDIYWSILYWDNNKFVAYHRTTGKDYKYFCEIDAKKIICNYEKYDPGIIDYHATYTYILNE